MLDEFENIYQAKIELVKLEGIERTSGILSRMTGVLLVALIIIVACVAGLALLSMLIGHWLQDGTVALYVFSGSILIMWNRGFYFFYAYFFDEGEHWERKHCLLSS